MGTKHVFTALPLRGLKRGLNPVAVVFEKATGFYYGVTPAGFYRITEDGGAWRTICEFYRLTGQPRPVYRCPE